ncbi:hydrophobin-319 [Panaeolus papilionaceus]|nr:hydrophobin-319 [Panaeolus papilionaceus]
MYTTKLAVLAAVSLAVNAAVLPRGGDASGNNNACNTGPVQCCNTLQSQADSPLTGVLGLLGVVLGPVSSLIGTSCSPVNASGVGGNSCSAQPVCCNNVAFNGLVNVGCSPINIHF